MPTKSSKLDSGHGFASREDVHSIFGELDEAKIIQILALRPTLTELEEASMWAQGAGDVIDRTGHHPDTVTNQIVEIVMAGEEEEDR